MKAANFTTEDCRAAIDDFLPGFKHFGFKNRWKRFRKFTDFSGARVRWFSAFEDRSEFGEGYRATYVVVTEVAGGLEVRKADAADIRDMEQYFGHTI